MSTRRGQAKPAVAAVLMLLSCTSVAQGAVPPSLDTAMTALAATQPESTEEAQAMSAAIAAARSAAPPAAAVPQDLLARAKTVDARDAAVLAADLDSAARRAPWVAEVHFAHGSALAKAGRNAAAARAFALYLEAAPAAPDRAQVNRLIVELRRQPDASFAITAAGPRAGEIFRDCPNCPEMVAVPTGAFVMGSPDAENGRFDSEGPQHRVTVRRFALSRYPVTEAEFVAFLSATAYQPAPCNRILDKTWRSPGGGIVFPPGMADLPRQPAVCVNWDDALAYITWLNGRAGNGRYRLPSEAEWEYAARAGTQTARWWGEAVGRNNANCHGCGSQWDNALIAPVGSFAANAFGFYDMLGNTWQWVADCWNENYAGAPEDGSPWQKGDCSKHVMRGGSWSNLPVFIRSAARSRGDSTGADFDYSSYVGFRVAKPLP